MSVFLETSILTIPRTLLYIENIGKWICCFGLLFCYFPMLIENNGTPSYQHVDRLCVCIIYTVRASVFWKLNVHVYYLHVKLIMLYVIVNKARLRDNHLQLGISNLDNEIIASFMSLEIEDLHKYCKYDVCIDITGTIMFLAP